MIPSDSVSTSKLLSLNSEYFLAKSGPTKYAIPSSSPSNPSSLAFATSDTPSATPSAPTNGTNGATALSVPFARPLSIVPFGISKSFIGFAYGSKGTFLSSSRT